MGWEETALDLAPQVSVFLFTFVILWVYIHVNHTNGALQYAVRNQRICDNHSFENETVRYAAWVASLQKYKVMKIVLLVMGILCIVACIVSFGFSVFSIIKESEVLSQNVTRIILVSIIMILVTAILLVVYSVYSWRKHLGFMASSMDSYRADVKAIMNAFAEIPKTGDRGKWMRYREILSKRIAKRLNMSSLYEAEDKLDSMIGDIVANKDQPMKEPPEILDYIEFDKSRDYNFILQYVIAPYVKDENTIKETTKSLENLSILDKYNPLDASENRFQRIKTLLIVATFVAAYAWLRLLAHYKLLSIAILTIIIMITTGLYMSY